MADSVDAVTKIVVSLGADAAGATLASLALREGEDRLRLMGLRGGREGDERRWATFPMSLKNPVTDAVGTGERVILTGKAAIEERYPDLDGIARGRAVADLPAAQRRHRTIGAIGLSFPGRAILDAAELEFLEILADTCAQALERIERPGGRRRADAPSWSSSPTPRPSWPAASTTRRPSRRWPSWPSRRSRTGARSTSSRTAGCTALAVAHVDPAKVQLARELAERYPADPDAPNGAWSVHAHRPERADPGDHRRDAGRRRAATRSTCASPATSTCAAPSRCRWSPAGGCSA